MLAVGGMTVGNEGVPCQEVRQYNPTTNTWQVISQMNVAHSECAIALLPDSKLMVLGGIANGDERLIEGATLL